MIRIALAAPALIVGTTACATEVPPGGAEANMHNTACHVSVAFGSFAMGIDTRAAAAIEQLIRSDGSVTEVTRSPHGIEGEYALCVRTRTRAAAARLFDAIRRMLIEPTRAPVTLTGPDRTYSAPTKP